MDSQAAIAHRNGILPRGYMRGEVCPAHMTPGLLQHFDNGLPDHALVKSVFPFLSDQGKCARQAGVTKDFAGLRAAAVNGHLMPVRRGLQLRARTSLPKIRSKRSNGEALF